MTNSQVTGEIMPNWVPVKVAAFARNDDKPDDEGWKWCAVW
jgi:hypothetical protein